jgi:hypothetical protein
MPVMRGKIKMMMQLGLQNRYADPIGGGIGLEA